MNFGKIVARATLNFSKKTQNCLPGSADISRFEFPQTRADAGNMSEVATNAKNPVQNKVRGFGDHEMN